MAAAGTACLVSHCVITVRIRVSDRVRISGRVRDRDRFSVFVRICLTLVLRAAMWFYFLTNTTTPPQAVWAYRSGCSLRGPLTCATSIHRSPPC